MCEYADKVSVKRSPLVMTAVHQKYQKPANKDDKEIPPNSYAVEQTEHEQNYPESEKNARRPQDVKIHRADSTENNAKKTARDSHKGYLSLLIFCYAVVKEKDLEVLLLLL